MYDGKFLKTISMSDNALCIFMRDMHNYHLYVDYYFQYLIEQYDE